MENAIDQSKARLNQQIDSRIKVPFEQAKADLQKQVSEAIPEPVQWVAQQVSGPAQAFYQQGQSTIKGWQNQSTQAIQEGITDSLLHGADQVLNAYADFSDNLNATVSFLQNPLQAIEEGLNQGYGQVKSAFDALTRPIQQAQRAGQTLKEVSEKGLSELNKLEIDLGQQLQDAIAGFTGRASSQSVLSSLDGRNQDELGLAVGGGI